MKIRCENSNQGFETLTVKRIIATIKVWLGNKLWKVGYDLQINNQKESYIFGKAEF